MRTLLGSIQTPALLLLGLAGGCGAPAPRPVATAPAEPPAARPSDVTLADRNWGVLRNKALGLKLALPEARAWLGPEQTPPGNVGWELRHEPTGSTLSVRRWRASRLPQLDVCELELRQRVPNVPVVDESNLVATRNVRVPEGFTTRLTLLSLPGKGARLRGQVLAIGAGVGECLSAIASTDCSSEAELAERLRLLDAALGHLRLLHIEDRVPAPAPVTR